MKIHRGDVSGARVGFGLAWGPMYLSACAHVPMYPSSCTLGRWFSRATVHYDHLLKHELPTLYPLLAVVTTTTAMPIETPAPSNLPTFQQSPQPCRPYRRPQAITVPHRKNRYISNSHPKPKGRNPSRPGPASCNPVSRVTIDCHPPSPRAQSRRRRRTRLTPSSAYAPHTSDAPRYGRNGRIVGWELAQPVSICLTAPRSITCQVL